MIKRTPAIEEAIRHGGFYKDDGTWNSIMVFSCDPHIYRGRVETIIIKDLKEVYMKKDKNGKYFLPGGSFGNNISNMDQAINECLEEAHIKVRNIQSTGITYKEIKGVPDKYKNNPITWDADFTEIYIAEYDSIYRGNIPDVDQDPFILSGKFYPIKHCFEIFKSYHKDVLLNYLKLISI